MKELLFALTVAVAFMLTGAGKAAENASQGNVCRAAVLVYHRLARHRKNESRAETNVTTDPAAFEAHMSYLAENGFAVVPYGAVIDCIDGVTPLPPKAVVITFDDGLISQFTKAFPVLVRHGFTATFFVVTKSVGQGPALMSWDQLRELRDAGMTIGSHTRTHPFLTQVVGERHMVSELSGSSDDIERELGTAPQYLAYPYGDLSARVMGLVQAAGYRSARSIHDSPEHKKADVFRLRITGTSDSLGFFKRAVGRI
jgi:peptidoglycan/xylan/chitin deacetylase (PgdA/CDA1 family)